MTKLLLEIESKNPKLTINTLSEWMLEKRLGITAYDWVNGEQRIKEINDIDYVTENDLLRGDRKYYKRNELSENKITNDSTRYTNPQFTRFECCICLKIKPVSRLLADYLGRCISCQHR